MQRVFEELRRRFEQIIQPRALVLPGLVTALVAKNLLGHWHASFGGKSFDRFGKAQALGQHHELEDIAVLAGGKTVIEALDVVDEERRRLLHLEGREAGKFAPLPLQRNFARDDLADRQSRADFIEKSRGEAHDGSLSDSRG